MFSFAAENCRLGSVVDSDDVVGGSMNHESGKYRVYKVDFFYKDTFDKDTILTLESIIIVCKKG